MIRETLSLSLQETLTELDGFRDFVFVISSILRIIVIGNYLPSMSVSKDNTHKKHPDKIRRALELCCEQQQLCFAESSHHLPSNVHAGGQRGADGFAQEVLQL